MRRFALLGLSLVLFAGCRAMLMMPRPMKRQPPLESYTNVRIGDRYQLLRDAGIYRGAVYSAAKAERMGRWQPLAAGTRVRVLSSTVIGQIDAPTVEFMVVTEPDGQKLEINQWMTTGHLYGKNVAFDPEWWSKIR